jgi:26S proteasome regulatory subunit N5
VLQSDIQAAIEKLSALEKQTRQASDLPSTSRILIAIVTLCKDAGDWALLNDQVLVLSKKHSQLKQAITRMVQTVMTFLDSTPNLETKLSVIETLRTVTEGKIFVEVERARVTKILSDIKKSQGDLKAATDILTELQVETFGSMDRREKVEFILAQVALCIESGDWTQAGILARKISTKYLSRKPKKTAEQLEKEAKERQKRRDRGEDVVEEKEDDVTDLKLRYYEQQITLAKHDDKYLDACKDYRQVLDTEAVEEDPEKLRAVSLPDTSTYDPIFLGCLPSIREAMCNLASCRNNHWRAISMLTSKPAGAATNNILRHPSPLRQRTK